jgi:hypothetical protein
LEEVFAELAGTIAEWGRVVVGARGLGDDDHGNTSSSSRTSDTEMPASLRPDPLR